MPDASFPEAPQSEAGGLVLGQGEEHPLLADVEGRGDVRRPRRAHGDRREELARVRRELEQALEGVDAQELAARSARGAPDAPAVGVTDLRSGYPLDLPAQLSAGDLRRVHVHVRVAVPDVVDQGRELGRIQRTTQVRQRDRTLRQHALAATGDQPHAARRRLRALRVQPHHHAARHTRLPDLPGGSGTSPRADPCALRG